MELLAVAQEALAIDRMSNALLKIPRAQSSVHTGKDAVYVVLTRTDIVSFVFR